MDAEEKTILEALEQLPLLQRANKLEWVQLMVAAWNDADKRSNKRCQVGLIIDDPKMIADAISLAEKRYSLLQSSERKYRMGGRHSRIQKIHVDLEIAMEHFWKFEFSAFLQSCEIIEMKYRPSTVREALRKAIK